MNYGYVYAVCGARSYIDELHLSIKHLSCCTGLPVVVVTDKSRNEIPVRHSSIIDVETPEKLTNAQAAVFLKTSLHRILDVQDKRQTWCYLDSDVFAVHPDVDEVFRHRGGVVNFARADSCLARFSPYAVNCGCLGEVHDLKRMDRAQRFFVLLRFYRYLKLRAILRLDPHVQVVDPRTFFESRGFFRDEKRHAWFDAAGGLIHDSGGIAGCLLEALAFLWDMTRHFFSRLWARRSFGPGCDHLARAISSSFGIPFIDGGWRHWNGGLFLFDGSSFSFLQRWHEYTLSVFDDPFWRTRDQGTLAAAVWHDGLQDAECLPDEYNFTADYFDESLSLDWESFLISSRGRTLRPRFLHVINGVGLNDWLVWRRTVDFLVQSQENRRDCNSGGGESD